MRGVLVAKNVSGLGRVVLWLGEIGVLSVVCAWLRSSRQKRGQSGKETANKRYPSIHLFPILNSPTLNSRQAFYDKFFGVWFRAESTCLREPA
jgi:hypothetical protein